MHKTAVIILNWNGREHLERFLPGVVRYSRGDGRKIVVADNGSSDDSVRFLKERFPEVERVVFPENYGFSEGYNRAVEAVEADYCLLLNSDVEVTEGWLDPLERTLELHPEAASVMPKIRSVTHPGAFEYAGACGGFLDALGYPFCRGRVLDHVENDGGQYDNPREVFWTSGACMLVRREVYRECGGLDASFFAHQEEIDLCWRMQLQGWKLRVEPSSFVYHLGGGTLASDNPRKTFLNFRNNLAMLYKNLSGRSLPFVLGARFILDGLSAAVYLFGGRRAHCKAVWQAHRAFFRMLPELRAKRKAVRRARVASVSGIYRGSVLVRYFTGRKTSPVR